MKTFFYTLIALLFAITLNAQNMKIKVKKDAPAYSREEITIQAPIQKVYSLVADISKWEEWQTPVTFSQLNGELAEGTKFSWKANGLKIHSELHTVKKNTAIGWTGRIAWIKAVHNWNFRELGSGTRVVVEESLSGFGSSLMKKSLKDGMQKNLLELKEMAEKSFRL